jgi:uncharacterized protein YraI
VTDGNRENLRKENSMKHSSLFVILCLLMAQFLSACGAGPAGPQVWIDKPLDHTIAPPSPLSILAHASDSNGVASIEFYANGQLLTSVGAGGGRLGSAQYEWTPSDPGEYLIGVRGINNNGAAGDLATSWVTISGKAATTPTERTAITEETSVATATVTASATVPPPITAPSVIARTDANCREGPGTSYGVYGSLLAGQEALIKGRLADNSWLLITLASRSTNCWVATSVMDVRGDLGTIQVAAAPPLPMGVPSTEAPTVQIQPPAAIDTTPPAIYGTSIQPETICGSGSANRTATSIVVAIDASGISKIHATWSLSDPNGVIIETGYVDYVFFDPAYNAYRAEFGPVNNVGTINITGTVMDNAGNTTMFYQIIKVNEC